MSRAPVALCRLGFRALVSGIVLVILAPACSPNPGGAAEWRAEVLRAADLETISAAQRASLSDGVITQDEYEKAVAELSECATDGGAAVAVRRSSRGVYSFRVTEMAPGARDAFEACQSYETNPVTYLYPSILANPDRLDYDDLVRSCLVDRGLATTTDTATDLARLIDVASRNDALKTEECLDEPGAFIG